MALDSQTRETGASRVQPTLRVLVVASQPDLGEICSVLSGLTEPHLEVTQAEIGAPHSAVRDRVDVVMFVCAKTHQQPAPPVVTARGSKPPLRIGLMHERSPQAIREALRAGADEVLFLPLDQGDLARALLKLSEARRSEEPAVSGKLISIVSVTGGAGVTTIAANCALALTHTEGKKVALVDLDFQSGDLAVALNIEPERTMRDLADSKLRLSSVQIEAVLTRHPSGVFLLGAPLHIEESEQIHAARVGAVLDVMRQMVDVVIVDIGRHIDDISVVVWERSDELLYVIDQSIAGMRGAWRFLDLFGRLQLTAVQPRFVLNRWMPRHPINEKQIVNTLGRPLIARIPRDDAALEQALGRGEDLWKAAPRSGLIRSYEALVRELSGPHHTPKKNGFLRKFFSRNGTISRS